MLLVHQCEGFHERGVSVSVSYNPTPLTPLGFMAKVAPSWGAQATDGAQALCGREMMAGLAHGDGASGKRLDGEVGYGLPLGSRFVGTPRVGLTTSEYGRAYRLGYRMTLLVNDSLGFELGVDAQHRESPAAGNTGHGFRGRATLGWLDTRSDGSGPRACWRRPPRSPETKRSSSRCNDQSPATTGLPQCYDGSKRAATMEAGAVSRRRAPAEALR